MKSMKPIKQLKLSVPAQETPITSFLTASGTFQDGDLLLNQKGLRLISEEDDSLPSDAMEIDLQFSPEDLETIKFIGKGSGGMVQLVRHKWVGTLFALKQKVLLRVTMTDSKKSRTKAMKIAATVSGVESVAIKGDDKDQIEVIGEGIDTVGLAKLLRKNVGHTDLLSVGPAKEDKKEEKKAAENKNEAPVVPLVWGSIPYTYNYPVYEVRDSGYDPGCSIM